MEPSNFPIIGWALVTFWPRDLIFTIELGIFFPEIIKYYHSVDGEITIMPKKAMDCHIRNVIGHVTKDMKAIWWGLYYQGSKVDISRLSKDVFNLFIEYGIPWFNKFNSCEQGLEYLLNNKVYHAPIFVIPSLFICLGQKQEAIKHLELMYSDRRRHHIEVVNKKYKKKSFKFLIKGFNDFTEKNNLGIHFEDELE